MISFMTKIKQILFMIKFNQIKWIFQIKKYIV